MSLTADPIVAIPSFDELNPAFRERARRRPGAARAQCQQPATLLPIPRRSAERPGLFRGGCEAHDSVQ